MAIEFFNPKGLTGRVGAAFKFDKSDASLYGGAVAGFWMGKGIQLGVDRMLAMLPAGAQSFLDKGAARLTIRSVVAAALTLVTARVATSFMRRSQLRLGLGAGAGVAALHTALRPILPASLQGWSKSDAGGRAPAQPSLEGQYLDRAKLGAGLPTHKATVAGHSRARAGSDRYGRNAAMAMQASN